MGGGGGVRVLEKAGPYEFSTDKQKKPFFIYLLFILEHYIRP